MAEDLDTITLAAELTAAWLGNPNTRVSSEDVPAFLSTIHQTLGKLAVPAEEPAAEPAAREYTPAVSVRKSLASPHHILSMIDGKPYRTLKRHLSVNGLTPAEYRERYGLKADYPMVAPAYSEARRETAKKIGLGRKPGQQPGGAAAQADAPAPKARGRGKAAAAHAETPASERKPRKRKGLSDATAAAKAHLGGDTDA